MILTTYKPSSTQSPRPASMPPFTSTDSQNIPSPLPPSRAPSAAASPSHSPLQPQTASIGPQQASSSRPKASNRHYSPPPLLSNDVPPPSAADTDAYAHTDTPRQFSAPPRPALRIPDTSSTALAPCVRLRYCRGFLSGFPLSRRNRRGD